MMNPQYPETRDDLQRMLHAGMGRAVLYLLDQDVTQYRDLILDSCLHHYGYDFQVEENHAHYLYPLVSRDKSYYRREILTWLPKTEDWNDTEQLLDLALLLAKDGDEQAREALYTRVRQQHAEECLTGHDQIIELDGIQGLLYLLDLIGSNPSLQDFYSDDYIIETAENTSSIEEVRVALRAAAARNANIAAALDNIEDYSPDWTAEKIISHREERAEYIANAQMRLPETMTWEEVKNSTEFSRLVFQWSTVASEQEIEKAARDLDPDEEPRRLSTYLRMFRKRPFPLEPSILVRLLRHSDERVAIAAIVDLEIVQHQDVRALFEQLIQGERWRQRAIGLLRSNYRNGDDKIIVDLLARENEADSLHTMCFDTIDVYRDNPVQEGTAPLLLVYERDPCSRCRCRCLEMIMEITELPDWMIQECLYDSYSGTRELAAGLRGDSVS